jgi:hypothetical protein
MSEKGEGGATCIHTKVAAASKRHTPRSHIHLSYHVIARFLTLGIETTTATRTSDLPPRSHHATDPTTVQMALLCRMYYRGFRLDGYLLIICQPLLLSGFSLSVQQLLCRSRQK